MKFSTFVAFICALVVHLLLLLLLVVNVSLDKPQRPQDAGVKIMHATVITPPAKGKETGSAQNIKKPQETVKKNTDDSKRKAQEEALKKRVEAQKKAEEQRVLALKKKQEEQKKLEEKKRKEAEAKAKAEAEAKAKAEAEAKAKAEAEAKAKAKAEAEAKKKAQEEKERLEKEAKEKAEAEAKRLEQEAMEAQKKLEAQQEAALLEQELLGTADGVEGGEGLGSGADGIVAEYGAKVQTLVEQNWRIDPSMNGKKVVVTLEVDAQGLISNEKCQGDKAVCDSALATLRLIGMLPMPPKDCLDCNNIVITMTPKL